MTSSQNVNLVPADMDVPDSPSALLCMRENDQKSSREQLPREHRQGKQLTHVTGIHSFLAVCLLLIKLVMWVWHMQAAIYPGNVLSLHMKKPPGFKYKSGMYLFVKCPDVSPFEW